MHLCVRCVENGEQKVKLWLDDNSASSMVPLFGSVTKPPSQYQETTIVLRKTGLLNSGTDKKMNELGMVNEKWTSTDKQIFTSKLQVHAWREIKIDTSSDTILSIADWPVLTSLMLNVHANKYSTKIVPLTSSFAHVPVVLPHSGNKVKEREVMVWWYWRAAKKWHSNLNPTRSH